ncbi:MAG: sugar phosphate isomerase/epimerase [Clostridia bacterium]|nr:sugar phosphate isomerase/epimerase [Clostridia bacterium]
MKIATQTFGLKKEFEQDLSGTIQRLHDMGFTAIEPLILFQKEQGNKTKNLWAQDTLKIAAATMQKCGMTFPSAHIGVGISWFIMPAKNVIEGILNVHEAYGITDFVVGGVFGSAALAKHWAKMVRTVTEGIRPHGCRLVYHNHDDEFHAIRGGNAMDIFFENCGPNVMMQIDIGWAGMAGDEYEIVNKYADRVVSLHLKDFYPNYRGRYTRKNMPVEAFAPIGEGDIRTRDVLGLIPQLKNFGDTVIIDQDAYAGDMMESLKLGIGNIQKML